MTPSFQLRILIPALSVALLGAAAIGARAEEPILGGPCEGCRLVFDGRPADPPAVARIAPADEPGAPMTIEGTVTDAAGRPAPGVIVYAYQTDEGGIYPDAATRHGALRAWARTDAEGRYRFDTIRPGGYPGTSIPQHVHMHVIEPGRATYVIDDVRFTDDPRLDVERARAGERARGGSGIVTPRRDDDGVWRVRRDIVLGRNVRGYAEVASGD